MEAEAAVARKRAEESEAARLRAEAEAAEAKRLVRWCVVTTGTVVRLANFPATFAVLVLD